MRFVLFVALALFTTQNLLAADPVESWALRPVKRPSVPKLDAAGQAWAKTPIDTFIWAKLQEKGLTPSTPADPRTLIRRVYFDLTGLPPSPEQVDAFLKNPTEQAYRQVVDDLLASPHYGEQWARHWLDIVRYGESEGFERNPPRPNAWHYRDWVIRALNNDMPYDRFTKMQLAGDVIMPDDPDGVKATGFLVAGIHNTVLGSNKIANETARQDELEDMIATIGQTFLGLTVQCARCHDHKFDPVSQFDYYQLAAAIGGVTHGERTVVSATATATRNRLTAERDDVNRQLASLENTVRQRVIAKTSDGKQPRHFVTPVARWSFTQNTADERGRLPGELLGGAKVERGRLILNGKSAFLQTGPLPFDLREKTLEVWAVVPDLNNRGGGLLTVEADGGARFDSIVYGERQPKKWMAGSEFYRRTQDRAVSEESITDRPIHMAIVYAADGSIQLYRDGQPYGDRYTPPDSGLQSYKAGAARILLGKRHTGGGNVFFRGEIDEARVYDRALTAAELLASANAGPDSVGISQEQLMAEFTATERETRTRLLEYRTSIEARLTMLPGPTRVFAVVPTVPPTMRVLGRGDVERKKDVVAAGGVESIPGRANFGLPTNAPDGERRQKLAEWIARADNPLFNRVIVNRLWQHHFGIGIVDTPSDFGFNGGKPSHQELLDWLASELVTNGFRLKPIHQQMVLSAAYRQSSQRDAKAVAVDADNRLLWRKSPTRLEAEALRDAILATSGQLNLAMGGAPFHDVKAYGDAGTTFYQPIDPIGPEFNRRTIYRFSPRGERSAVLETFDCPDPSAQTPRRQVTTTPLQALALWNSTFVLRSADAFAERVTTDCRTSGNTDATSQVKRAYHIALGREPLATELKPAVAVVTKHGLKALTRVLLNCSEFVVIE